MVRLGTSDLYRDLSDYTDNVSIGPFGLPTITRYNRSTQLTVKTIAMFISTLNLPRHHCLQAFVKCSIRLSTLGAFVLLSLFATQAASADLEASWDKQLEQAKGQTVYFNAWGGSDRINAYLEWAAKRIKDDYGVTLEHVKVGDIAEVVGQVEAAKAVGRDTDGNVDLMWVNGENFPAMKRNDLIWGAFAEALPNTANVQDSPSIKMDFSVPVEGLESPWGAAQPPKSVEQLLTFVQEGGRFAYPAPPAFHGTTMVKQMLHELSEQPDALAKPVGETDFESVTAPLWDYLDKLHPLLWGKGKSWPPSAETTRQMLDDGELDIGLSFNPNEASAAVKDGQLPDSIRTYVFDQGTIGNTHFVTIPYNAKAKEGAMVVANFLISSEAQAHKANPEIWGDPTVLNINALSESEKKQFSSIDLGPWVWQAEPGKTLPEPHASWAGALEQAWLERYGR